MTPERSAKLTMVLSAVAAGLAFTAAIISFTRDGEIKWTLIAAGLFILTFGISAKARLKPPS